MYLGQFICTFHKYKPSWTVSEFGSCLPFSRTPIYRGTLHTSKEGDGWQKLQLPRIQPLSKFEFDGFDNTLNGFGMCSPRHGLGHILFPQASFYREGKRVRLKRHSNHYRMDVLHEEV